MLRTAFQRSLSGLTKRSWTPMTRPMSTLKIQPMRRPCLEMISKNNTFKAQQRLIQVSAAQTATKPIVGYWLYFNAGLIFAIVVVGGLTRLTESGLSITEWNVISGMKPPRSEQEWVEEFEKYKQFPEYKL